MADSGDEEKLIYRKIKDFKGRNAAKLPKDPIHRLFYREFGGSHRHHRQALANQIFHKLPGRLAFSLKSLVDENVLHDGHVFLGFTKSGNFVLSYTQSVEADEHTEYPTNVYRLQWWRFIPYRKLRKVAEIRLFGEEEIERAVFLEVCEWPNDDSRVAIHGYCVSPTDNEEKHQCYVTVAAAPAVAPCEDCIQLAILSTQNGYSENGGSVYESPPRCIMHGFVVHTKYELAPPYPRFYAKVFMKLDGVVVLNTGDSLVAVSVDIEDNHGGFGFGLYSPRVARTMSTISSVSSTAPSDDQVSTDSHDPVTSETPTDLLGSFLPTSPPPYHGPYSRPGMNTPKDTTNMGSPDRPPGLLRERRVSSTGKENQLSKSLGSPLAVHTDSNRMAVTDGQQMTTPSRPSQPHRGGGGPGGGGLPPTPGGPMDVYNFDTYSTPTLKKEEEEFCDTDPTTSAAPTRCMLSHGARTSLSFRNNIGATFSSLSEDPLEAISLLPPAGSDSQNNSASDTADTVDGKSGSLFEKPLSLPRAAPRVASTPLSLVPPPPVDAVTFTKALCSPGYNLKYDTGSSTCSSCVSNPIILQSDSQCFTYSVRRYIEHYGLAEGTADVEDDLNLAYHSVLPLEVHGANYSPLRLLTKQCTAPQMPCVVVKQLTLDIEHYLGEAVKTKADWGHRYMSFTDYDVQVVEVSAETSEVVALVIVLIRARPPRDKKQPHHHHGAGGGLRALPRLYQSQLKLSWNLKTGIYTTLDIDDLVEVNQAQLVRRKLSWCPGSQMCLALQRKYHVPQPLSRMVHSLSNEAVFKGKSLKMLLDRQNYVAILL